MTCIGDFDAALEHVKTPYSSLEVVKDTIPIALGSAYLGKIKNAIATVLNANLQIHSSHLKGIPIAYDRQNVKLLSGNGDILSDQACVHFTVKTNYVVFKPKIGEVIKGMVNKKDSKMIGCLVHEFFYCSVSCTKHQSDTCNFGDDILFKVEKLEEDGHGILSIIGSFVQLISSPDGSAPMETDSGIDERESTFNPKSPRSDEEQKGRSSSQQQEQQPAWDSILAAPSDQFVSQDEVDGQTSGKQVNPDKKKKEKKKKKDKKSESKSISIKDMHNQMPFDGSDEQIPAAGDTNSMKNNADLSKKKKKHKKEKKEKKGHKKRHQELEDQPGASKYNGNAPAIKLDNQDTENKNSSKKKEKHKIKEDPLLRNKTPRLKDVDKISASEDSECEFKIAHQSTKPKPSSEIGRDALDISVKPLAQQTESILSPKASSSHVDSIIESVVRHADAMSDGVTTEGDAQFKKAEVKQSEIMGAKIEALHAELSLANVTENVPKSPKKRTKQNKSAQNKVKFEPLSSPVKHFPTAGAVSDTGTASSLDFVIDSVVKQAAMKGTKHGKGSVEKHVTDKKSTKQSKKLKPETTGTAVSLLETPDFEESIPSDTGSFDMFQSETELPQPSAADTLPQIKPKKAKKRKLFDASGQEMTNKSKLPKIEPDLPAPVGAVKAEDMAKYYLAQMGLTLNPDGSTTAVQGKKPKKTKKKKKTKTKEKIG